MSSVQGLEMTDLAKSRQIFSILSFKVVMRAALRRKEYGILPSL